MSNEEEARNVAVTYMKQDVYYQEGKQNFAKNVEYNVDELKRGNVITKYRANVDLLQR